MSKQFYFKPFNLAKICGLNVKNGKLKKPQFSSI